MRIISAFILAIIFLGETTAQSTAFVFKGGLSLGTQKWDNSLDREFLWRYHAALAAESINNDDDRLSIYAQFGYHVRGSSVRFQYYDLNSGILGRQFRQPFEFNNLSLQLGAKIRRPSSGNSQFFYSGGIRGDYNLSTNLDELQEIYVCNQSSIPLESGVQKWLFGLSIGAGVEWAFSELVGGQIELSLHPDITPQYRQEAVPNVIDPCNPGYSYTIPQRRIRNTTIELSFGLRLLRKVVYVDE